MPASLTRSTETAPQAPADPPRGERFADLPVVWLRGLSFHAITESACVERVVTEAAAGRGGTVVTPNLHILRLTTRDAEAAELIASADLRTADGMPLVWASRVQGTPLPERVAGSSMIYPLCEAAAARGLSVYLLGGNPGVAERTAAVMTSRYRSLRVAGTQCPPMGFDRDAAGVAAVVRQVADARPDLVLVGLGCPKQERLMRAIAAELPSAWLLGVGYTFSFVAGETDRAPRWMQRVGLEWLHRLANEPGRLYRRYLLEGPPFLATTLAACLWRRLTGRAGPGGVAADGASRGAGDQGIGATGR